MQRQRFGKNDIKFMQKALKLAESAKGATGDNPAVGAVLYKNNRIIGTGKTNLPGQDHAEKEAIKKAGKKAKGATLVVSLEPCCFTGRTGPCTRFIIDAKIKRIIIAIKDPNLKVNGRGIRELKKAGIKVDLGLFKKEAFAINQDFFKFITTGIPFVSLKAALTLNGFIAANSLDSRWITSLQSRKIGHTMRAKHDAVAVGLNTIRQDNPLLTVRHVQGKNPIRIVVSDGKDISPTSKLAKTAHAIRTLVITSKPIKRPQCKHVEYIALEGTAENINIKKMLKKLGNLGIKSLLVEGGNRLFSSFLEQKCIDVLYLFFAFKLLSNGLPFISGTKTRSINGAVRLNDIHLRRLDRDLLVTARPLY
jgi:diaminohydroxyphosphoribosylaminopyrimidine deaminase/5-amino-6-(5-phosphoribosylamino)uracil reductase